jgi:RND family efflux transporter MFP subunit
MPLQATNKMLLQQLKINPEQRDEQSDRGRGRFIIYGVLALLALVAAGTMLALLRGQHFEIEVAAAIAPLSETGSSSAAVLQATGYVTARREATVAAQITGKLTEVLIEEGEHVAANQVLARLDSTAQQASLEQSEAQLEAAQALVLQSQTQMTQAYHDLRRDEGLIERQLISMQALETARTRFQSEVQQVESQRRQVKLARASMKGAQVALEYTTVRAPFAGVVIAKSAQAGEIISPVSAGGGFTRTGVGTIVDMDSLEIEVDVNESYINRVQPDQPAEAVLDAYPDWTVPAHVIATIPTADRSKATVKVRIAIDQKDPRILPDMGVRVSFLEQARSKAAPGTPADRMEAGPAGVLVPSSAIVERGEKSVVFVIDRGHARAQPVTPAQTYGDLRSVQGIESGTQLVKAPPAAMDDGARISIKAQK